jgi:hypothetical protein
MTTSIAAATVSPKCVVASRATTRRSRSRVRGRERFWREVDLYLEFWAIARAPAESRLSSS